MTRRNELKNEMRQTSPFVSFSASLDSKFGGKVNLIINPNQKQKKV